MSPEQLDALQKVSSLLESDEALDKTLRSVVDLSVAALPGCDAAGVTLMMDGKKRTAAASDDYTLELDHIQYEADEGPCVDAMRHNEMMMIESISKESRWVNFRRRAEEKGLRSSVSHPLVKDDSVGALNVYSKTDYGFDPTSIEVGRIFARQASIALKNTQAYLDVRKMADHLNVALQSRDVIGAAKGILMEREGVSDEEAFAMLTRISQHANVKLRDIAESLVRERAQQNSGDRN